MFRPPAILLICLCTLFPLAAPAADPSYADDLIERARALRLAEAPAWHKLLHYLPSGDGVLSEIDSTNFFLADSGRRDSAAEMAATLRAFLRPADAVVGDRDEHPQCRYIARFSWLDEQLGFDRTRMTVHDCPQFTRWHDTINPHSMSLVFPAAYLNNPSSMFGHTLLRIDPPPDSGRGELTSYAINFAAQTEETNGVLFAVRGLTGLYVGRYSLRKYYELVNDYSEIESRDIWSYPLDFTTEEIDRMLRHLWEMEDAGFDYYFLSENCSYQLLRLLETARPGLDLASGFFYPVEPSATVKRITEAGLAREPEFRASLVTRIRHRASLLPPDGREWIADLVAGTGGEPPSGLDERQRAVALETAFDLLKHRQTEGAIDSDTYGERALPILAQRSRLPRGRAQAPSPPDTAPHRAHDATRLGVGVGATAAGNFAELGFRPSFHSLTERSSGFTRGAQIEVLDTRVRIPEDDTDEPDLQHLMVADIISLAPRGELIRPKSWRFRGGYRHVWLDEETSEGTIAFEGGIGPAWALDEDLTVYGFVQGQLLVDRELPKGASAGAGLRLGLAWSPDRDWSLHAWAEAHEHPSRIDATLVEGTIRQTLALSRDWALDLRLIAHGRTESTSGAGLLNLQYYY